MASQGVTDPYAAHYEASPPIAGASLMHSGAAAPLLVAQPAASAAADPSARHMRPPMLVNSPARQGATAPPFFSYIRQLGSQYIFPSSSPSSLPAEGPPGVVLWQQGDPTAVGASFAAPTPIVPGVSFYQQTSSARPATLVVPGDSPTCPADTFTPGAAAAAPPRLLPPLSSRGGWLGRSHFSSAAFTAEDMPGFSSLRRGIVLCVMLLLVSSLFACIGRPDFNFVLYLLGYHLWCVESDTKTITGVKRLIRGARQYAVLLCIAAVVDTTWLFIAYSTWVCEKGDPELCFPEPENLKVRWAYGIHSWALGLSTLNLLLKLLVIFFSFAWVQQQRAALGLGGGGSMPGGTSILPPSIE